MDFYNNQLIFSLIICLILMINIINISNNYKKIFNFVFILEGFTNSLVFTQKIPVLYSIIVILISAIFLFKIIKKEKEESLI